MSHNRLAREAAQTFHAATHNGADPADTMRAIIDEHGINVACTITGLALALYCPQYGPQQKAYMRSLRIAWRAVIQPTHTDTTT